MPTRHGKGLTERPNKYFTARNAIIVTAVREVLAIELQGLIDLDFAGAGSVIVVMSSAERFNRILASGKEKSPALGGGAGGILEVFQREQRRDYQKIISGASGKPQPI